MLQIKQICKEYKTGDLVQKALDGVDLNLRDNEFVAILGPSGSGKTTLLNIIGGLDRYDSGDLIINGISTKEYKDRDWDSYRNHTIGFVFQSYNLIPHQTILANVELALTISGISKSERRAKALNALAQVGLKEQAHKKPSQLSGGQMQRVAIARALVNDPDILLADEPTGALDSDTSVQVMDLLKEVAKDRLVVMVTHNPELAEAYATRIVNLRDGKIRSDTNPFFIDESKLANPEHKNMGKSSMSFLTALSLSFNNLKTKKGRTLLTSFAGSIGIIGIALILSLSNGVNTYIKTIEEDTLSEYPLQIQSTGLDISSLMVGMVDNRGQKTTDEVHVAQMMTNMFSKIGSNDLASLKAYLDSEESNVSQYVNTIEYTYNVVPQIFSADTEHLRQVNPDKSFSALGLGAASSSNSLMSMAMSTNVFFPMPNDTDLFSDQYDVKAGRWPKKYNECVLVLTSKGSISDFMLYTLGLRDPRELDEMVTKFAAEEEVTIPSDIVSYHYDDILGITFKLVNASDYYSYDEEYKIWRNKSDDAKYMKNLVKNGEDLTIVGIVQPAEGATAAMLSTGIYYPSTLTDHVIDQAQQSEIVKAQLNHPNINVFTGKAFGQKDDGESSFNMASLFSIDTALLQSAFRVDESQLNIDLSGLNTALNNVSLPPLELNEILSQLDLSASPEQAQTMVCHLIEGFMDYASQHPEMDYSQLGSQIAGYLQSPEVSETLKQGIESIIKENGEINATIEQLQALLNQILSDYQDYAAANGFADPSKLNEHFMNYLGSAQAKAILSNDLAELIEASGLEAQMTAIIQNYMASAMLPVSQAVEQELTTSMSQLGASMANAFSFDADVFASAIQMNMNEEELTELLTSMMAKEDASYDNNLQKLGYADFTKPSGIDIYPKDFESKEFILEILDSYNDQMKAEGNDDKVITYTDLVGTLMSSVTDIINVISYVLIAFVAISLVVSSIMIGVITYISVLERKKEIGILRAIGASKRNISQVFNAETFIIGLCAGSIGIIVTLLLLIPGNQIIHSIAGQANINASLPITAGIILILLSVILTLIGGIIPSRKAAKEDPVTALRTD